MLASADDVLKMGNRVVGTGDVFRVYTVGQVRGAWAWLEAPDLGGWAKLDRLRRLDQAERLASEAIRRGDNAARAYNRRGLLRMSRGRTDLALVDFGEAIRIDPDWYLPYLNRGLAYREAGRLDDAIADFDRAAERYAFDPLISFNRGLARLGRSEVDLALIDFDAALRTDPDHAGSRFNLATIGLALGTGAADDAEAYLGRVGWYEELSPYAAIIAALDHRRSRQPGRASGLLDAAAGKIAPEAWPAPIIAYLRDELTLPALLDAAETPDRAAEARVYAGLELLFAGQVEEARPLLEWVAERSDETRIPHLLARSTLNRIETSVERSEAEPDIGSGDPR